MWWETASHRTLCSFPINDNDQTTPLNQVVGEFKPENETPPNNDNTVSGSVATSKNIQDKVDDPPLLAVNVRSADDVWIRENCFLDMRSDTTLVRKQFVNCVGIPHLVQVPLSLVQRGETYTRNFHKIIA
jgi:hypothetical protein